MLAPSGNEFSQLVHWLQLWLFVGGLFDLAGAAGFYFRPAWVERTLQLPKQLDFWPKYATVFLVVLATFYFATAVNPPRSIVNVGVAIFGRLLGALFYAGRCIAMPGRQVLLFGFAIANVVFALAYAIILRRLGWHLVSDALKCAEPVVRWCLG